MASNYKVTGLDLDSVFKAKTSGPNIPVQFYVNGVDIANRYQLSNTVSGSNPDQVQYDTRYVFNGYDLRFIFKNISTGNGPTIDIEPQDITVNEGDDITFSVDATSSGGTIYYQWQKRNGTTWTNLTNAGRISGVTTSSLSIINSVNSSDQGSYRCELTDDNGTVTTRTATATINYQPVITGPTNASYNEGDSPTVSITVSAQPAPISYVWKKNGDVITATTDGGIYSNYDAAVLVITNIPNSVSGASYTCTVTNSVGATTSSAAVITVYYQSVITSQPTTKTISVGDTNNLSLVANGRTDPTYQWQKKISGTWTDLTNTGNISGALTNSLIFTVAISSNNGEYRCVLTNIKGDGVSTWTTISNSVFLNVYSAPIIITNPSSATVNAGDAVGLSVVAQETYPAGLTYLWKVNNVAITGGQGYAGYDTANLTFLSNSTHDQKQYTCVVSNSFASATSSAATLTVYYQSQISSQPSSTIVNQSTNASFTLTAIGRSDPTYQWQKQNSLDPNIWDTLSNGSKYSGVTTNQLTVTNCQTTDTGYFRCLLNNYKFGGIDAWPQTISNTAYLIVYQPPVINTHPQDLSVDEPETATFTVVVTPGLPTTVNYQWQKYNGSSWDNITISTDGGVYGYTFLNSTLSFSSNASLDQAQYRCNVSSSFGSPINSNSATLTVYYQADLTTEPVSYTKNAGDSVTFTVAANGRATPTYQWQKSPDGTTWTNLSNNARISGVTSTSLTITSIESGDDAYYKCVLNNFKKNGTDFWITDSSAGDLTVRYIDVTGGTITQDHLLYIGNIANYTFSANSYPAINSYIYRKGITVVQNTSTYSPYSFTTDANSAGIYSLQVNNGYITKTITSNFYVQPSITVQPSNTTVNEGAGYSFSVTAVGSSLTYQWQISTNSGASWSNITDATSSSVTFLLSSRSSNGNQYRCIVSNSLSISGYPSAVITSNAATLTIYYTPTITSQPSNAFLNPTDACQFSVVVTAGNPQTNYQWYRNSGLGFFAINGTTDGGIYAGYTTANLTFSAANNLKNYQYYCIINNGNGLSVTSSTVVLYINPNIVSQPVSVAAYVGATASFSINADGSSLQYQWYENNVVISGATSSLYNKSNVQITDEGNYYKCTVTTSLSGFSATSNNLAQLTVYYAPFINTNPSNQFGNVGGSVTFSVSATTGKPGIAYQWERSTNNGASFSTISGANSSTYTVSSITNTVMGYQYRCVVSNADPSNNPSGKVTSAAGILYVNPNFTTNLPSTTTVTVPSGQNTTTATFSVVVNGSKVSAFTYDWQKKPPGGSYLSIVGANTSANSFSEIAVDESYNNRQYRVIVSSDLAGTSSVTSNDSTLIVNLTPISISSFLGNSVANPTINLGDPLTYVVTASGSGTLNYQFLRINYISRPSNFTITTVQNGSSNTYIHTPDISENDCDFSCYVTSSKTSLAGQYCSLSTLTIRYLIINSLLITTTTATTSITENLQVVNANYGTNVVFTIYTSSNPATVNYTWYKYNNAQQAYIAIPNSNSNTIVLSSVTASDDTYYACELSNTGGRQASTVGTKEFRLQVL